MASVVTDYELREAGWRKTRDDFLRENAKLFVSVHPGKNDEYVLHRPHLGLAYTDRARQHLDCPTLSHAHVLGSVSHVRKNASKFGVRKFPTLKKRGPRLEDELRALGSTLDRVGFRDLYIDCWVETYPDWSPDVILIHPREALIFAHRIRIVRPDLANADTSFVLRWFSNFRKAGEFSPRVY